MPKLLSFLFCAAVISSGFCGEILVEFDGKEWDLPEGFVEMTEEDLKGGVCFTADANVPVGISLEGLGLEQLLSHPVRFALRGQEGRGVMIDPILQGKKEAENVIGVICDGGQVIAICHPVEMAEAGIPDNAGRGIMDADLVGLESFLNAIREGVKRADAAEEIPRFVLVVRSRTSFGHMVKVLQLVRSAGCLSGVVRIDDGFPSMEFDIHVDPEVQPPVVKLADTEPSGRIVVNIRVDGTLTVGQNLVLADEAGVTDYVKRERKRLEAQGLTAKLCLRGDRDSVFKYSRSVIRAAASAGVDQVVFAVYESSEKKPDNALKIRETDLEMALPKLDDDALNAGEKDSVVVKISITKAGVISAKEGVELDKDADQRELPLLKAKLKEIAREKGVREKDLRVSVWVDPLTTQQRVIDVLNLLAQLEIKSVIFRDEEDH
ncbi:hypothetical protein HZ994_03785 [Akkermansiaceae bacterium]|nr:hypothetical protein HZ994_03785 [Akkermansiaceae bacterium]